MTDSVERLLKHRLKLTVVGGTAPLLAIWLISHTDSNLTQAFYLVLIVLLAMAVWHCRKPPYLVARGARCGTSRWAQARSPQSDRRTDDVQGRPVHLWNEASDIRRGATATGTTKDESTTTICRFIRVRLPCLALTQRGTCAFLNQLKMASPVTHRRGLAAFRTCWRGRCRTCLGRGCCSDPRHA